MTAIIFMFKDLIEGHYRRTQMLDKIRNSFPQINIIHVPQNHIQIQEPKLKTLKRQVWT